MLKQVLHHERRQFGRRQSRLSGFIHLPDGTRQTCQVHNYSESGALLSFAGAGDLPRTFELTIDRTAVRVNCELRHRNGTECGVQFRAEARGNTPAEDAPPQLLAYGPLLALAKAEQEAAEFDARYGHAIAPAAAIAATPRRTARA